MNSFCGIVSLSDKPIEPSLIGLMASTLNRRGAIRVDAHHDQTIAMALLTAGPTPHPHENVPFATSPMLFTGDVRLDNRAELASILNLGNDQPDSVYVVLVSSGAGGEGQGQVGSTLFIDNVLFDYTTGIVPLFGTSVAVDIYPIPATHQLTVQLSEALHQASLEIYNLQSQLMLQTPLSDLQTQLDVSSLSAGAYTYRITAAGMPVKKGVVQIVK